MIEPGAVTVAVALHEVAVAIGQVAFAIVAGAIIRAVFNK